MKNIFLCFLFIAVLQEGYSQNEFAAAAFYNDFKKIQADALEGFPKYKGSKRQRTINEEYHVKLLVPLADSGLIVFPVTGNPYVEYYFQIAKTKREIDQRAVNLREALFTAYEKQLYTRTETSTLNQYIFSNTYYFANPNDSLAIFKSSIYQENKRKYYLSLRIIGNTK